MRDLKKAVTTDATATEEVLLCARTSRESGSLVELIAGVKVVDFAVNMEFSP